MTTLRLYDFELSGNCYKVRLFCSLLGLPLEVVPVDLAAGAHKAAPLIEKNPFGEVPILEDGNLCIRDSQAILVYLARKAGTEDWLPTDAASMAQVMSWTMAGENEVEHGPADARSHIRFGSKVDLEMVRETAKRILGLMEQRLAKSQWLALDRPTIADIACMPYVSLGHEGGVLLTDYPAIRAWIDRIKALPGFVTMPGL
jgi:glutathione S-transferase